MAAGDRIFTCRGASHNAVDVDGVTHGSYTASPGQPMIDQGDAAAPGPAEVQNGKNNLTVQVFGLNQNTLLALLAAASADLVLKTKGLSGANEKVTVKSVKFTRFLGAVNVPRPDGGGTTQAYGIEGIAEWGASDTWATMLVFAADV